MKRRRCEWIWGDYYQCVQYARTTVENRGLCERHRAELEAYHGGLERQRTHRWDAPTYHVVQWLLRPFR